MGRLAVLPSEVSSHNASAGLTTGLPAGPAHLFPSDWQFDIPNILHSSSVYPGTLPEHPRDQFHSSQNNNLA